MRRFISLIIGVLLLTSSAAAQNLIGSDAQIAADSPVEFDLYGMEAVMPRIVGVDLPHAVGSQEEYAKLIDALKWSRMAKKIIPYIQQFAAGANFNDFLTYKLLSAYVDAWLPAAHSSVRAAVKQHLFDQMGFLTRLGLNPMGDGVVFLAFAQPVYDMKMVFEPPFRYYAIEEGELDFSDPVASDFSLLKLTSNEHNNRPVNLRIRPLNIPQKPEPFEFSGAGLTIQGSVNANLRELLFNYPRTNLDDIAASEPDSYLRQTVIAQLKDQLAGMKEKEAVNTLLAFIQEAFPYQTDEELHGFEKPYFPEEMFLQPASDCEDRSLLYSLLLKEVLGLESILISYADHIAVAVNMPNSNVRGVKISHNGKDYYISDPTYRGARTGRPMPEYESQTPEIL